MSEREEGIVKWFNPEKGFGFIRNQKGIDLFVHYSDIDMAGFKTLNEGELVSFEVAKTEKGNLAKKVKRLEVQVDG